MNTNSERDYLARRLETAKWNKAYADVFNINAPLVPSTYKSLIDAIQNNKFTLDTKLTNRVDEVIAELDEDDRNTSYNGYGPLYGIVFTDLPKADVKGYEAANKENGRQFTMARDIVMTQDSTAGLKALQDYEAWMPTATVAPVVTTAAA